MILGALLWDEHSLVTITHTSAGWLRFSNFKPSSPLSPSPKEEASNFTTVGAVMELAVLGNPLLYLYRALWVRLWYLAIDWPSDTAVTLCPLTAAEGR